MEQNTFDAIVVGSGVSGGWAAMELSKKGLKTLVLERGYELKHIVDYKTANLEPWEVERGGQTPLKEKEEHYKVQNRSGGAVTEYTKEMFVKDSEHPYKEVNRFDWIRGYHTGGRSIMWGKQVYRWSDLDFEANAKEGIAVDWPIRYKDIAPWYSYVEKFIGVSGEKLGLPHLPDGEFQSPMALNCAEKHLKEGIKGKFEDGRLLTIGRVAHITDGLEHDETPHRGTCQYRNRCNRGCPYGAYFSSNSSTLYVAEQSGNMTMKHQSVVHSVIYDETTGKAKGVRVVNADTKEITEYYAKIIFLCASSIASASILMNSTSDRFPNGMGNDSGQLGKNIMDHHFKLGAFGSLEGYEDQYYFGRRPNGIYIPRYRNLPGMPKRDYLRGFGYQGRGRRANALSQGEQVGLGADFKTGLTTPGPWTFGMTAFGECLPYEENFMRLTNEKDQFGLPILELDTRFRENEDKMRIDMKNDAMEMLEAAGFKDVQGYEDPNGYAVGLGIHEMGTARMGRDPKTSVLNGFNQIHAVPNVFVTDGSCMTSAGCQNPSITYMALTARAVDYAVKELNKQNL